MSVRSLNKVMLIGNLTRDPNLRFTPSNTAVCSFGIATNRSWSPSDGGEKQERVEFHNIVAWSKLADICGQLLHKGDKIYIEGRLQTRDWKGDDGTERKTTEIVIDNMILLRSISGQGGSSYSDSDSGDSSSKASKPSKAKKTSKKLAQDDNEVTKKGEVVYEEGVPSAEDISDDVPF